MILPSHSATSDNSGMNACAFSQTIHQFLLIAIRLFHFFKSRFNELINSIVVLSLFLSN